MQPIEVVIITVIVGALASVFVPRALEVRRRVQSERELATVNRVREALWERKHASREIPSSLDSAEPGTRATYENPFFDVIMKEPVVANRWTKSDDLFHGYVGPNGGVYRYNALTGELDTLRIPPRR